MVTFRVERTRIGIRVRIRIRVRVRLWSVPTAGGIRSSHGGGEGRFAQRLNARGRRRRPRACSGARLASWRLRSSGPTSRSWRDVPRRWRPRCTASWGGLSPRSPSSGGRRPKRRLLGAVRRLGTRLLRAGSLWVRMNPIPCPLGVATCGRPALGSEGPAAGFRLRVDEAPVRWVVFVRLSLSLSGC